MGKEAPRRPDPGGKAQMKIRASRKAEAAKTLKRSDEFFRPFETRSEKGAVRRLWQMARGKRARPDPADRPFAL
jgi:hypothetical protein